MSSTFIRLSLSLSVGTAMLARRPQLKLSTTLSTGMAPVAIAAAAAAAAAVGGQLALYRLTLFMAIPIHPKVKVSHAKVPFG